MLQLRPTVTLVLACLVGIAAAMASASPASAFTPAEAKAPMTVTIVRSDDANCGVDCPEWLAMTGKIGFETVGRLQAALARLGPRRVPVFVDSPGGETRAGLALGQMIRAHRLDVVVAGTALANCAPADRLCLDRLRAGIRPGSPSFAVSACASACVFVLAGGVDRSVPPGSYVGVHQAKQVQTFRRVMNTFRILRRLENGRPVEVSRTLVATHALPSRTVVTAAPETLYSEFDHFLIRMGIGESIMPLMRATPPSGIHWMTADELASTRIATDDSIASVLLGREVLPATAAKPVQATPVVAASAPVAPAPVAPAPVAPAPAAATVAALTLDDGRQWLGTATWQLDLSTTKAPKLVLDVAIPEKHITATLTMEKSTTAGDASFSALVRFNPGTDDPPPIVDLLPLRVCDVSSCVTPMTPSVGFDGGRFGSYAFDVPFRWFYPFLSELGDRLWLELPLRTADGWGRMMIPLTGTGSVTIARWERLCCGIVTPAKLPRPAPDPPLPPPVVAAPVVAAPVLSPTPSWHVVDAHATYHYQIPGFDHLADGTTLFSWISLAPHAAAPAGVPVLLATTEIEAARLSMSIEVAPAAPVSMSRLLLTIHPLAEDPEVFGPITSFSASTELGGWGDPLLLPVWSRPLPRGNAFWLAADVPLTGEMPKRIEIEFDDARHRRVVLTVPIDDAVAVVLQAAARKSALLGGGS